MNISFDGDKAVIVQTESCREEGMTCRELEDPAELPDGIASRQQGARTGEAAE